MKDINCAPVAWTKRTQHWEFHAKMDPVVQCPDLVEVIAPFTPPRKLGRLRCPVESRLTVPLSLDLTDLVGLDGRRPDESAALHFRHSTEKRNLAERSLTTVTSLLGAKSLMLRRATLLGSMQNSTKNVSSERELREVAAPQDVLPDQVEGCMNEFRAGKMASKRIQNTRNRLGRSLICDGFESEVQQCCVI